MAENPPFGASFTFWLKEALQTAKQKRVASTKPETTDYPSPGQLTAEADEEPPQVLLTITDAAGKVVKRLTGPTTRGIHRVAWNLRGPAASAVPGRNPFAGDSAEEQNLFAGGPFVTPGVYKVSLSKRSGGVTTPLGAEASFTVDADPALSVKPEERKAREEFITRVLELQRKVTGALDSANGAHGELTAIRRALLDSPADAKLIDDAAALDKRLTAILRKLRGDETLRGLESGSASSIQSRVNSAGAGSRNSTGSPTGTQRLNYQVASEEFTVEQPRLRSLVDDLRKLKAQLDAAGVPYTAGRYQ
jgi:hypothetical protein